VSGGKLRCAAVLLAVLGCGATSGCGGSGHGDVVLTVGARNLPEQALLGEIYAQALEAAGYEVRRKLDLGFEDIAVAEEFEGGGISGYPEHLNTVLEGFGVEGEALPSDAGKAYAEAKTDLERQGLTAFPPTPFSLSHAVGMLRKTAEARDLKTMSDLHGQAEEMTLEGPLACHLRLDCLGGIEAFYRTSFEGFSEGQFTQRYKILEDGKADASMLYTTDGQLAAERGKFVILADDKHVYPAGNAVFVTTRKAVEEAGPDYEKAIVAAQKGLTLPVMQRLDARVELEKQTPREAAAAYLSAPGHKSRPGHAARRS
jgi:osmoprotectant transport system substrate-binding protein